MTQIKQFKDLGIKCTGKGFTGDKIKMNKILNKQIVVLDFKIEPSKFPEKGNSHCLHLQIELNSTKHVVFTIARQLMEAIQQVPKNAFPFQTEIIENGESFVFS